MIKDIKVRIQTDPRGKITTGGKDAEGKMQKYSYFNIAPFPELAKAYGIKPTALVIFPPTDNITDWFDCWYELWGGKGKTPVCKRRCDGETAIVAVDVEVDGKTYKAGWQGPCICKAHNIPERVPGKNGEPVTNGEHCRYHAWLKAFIGIPQMGRPDNPLCYEFHTHSKNSGDGVISELRKAQQLSEDHRLAGLPFMLGVRIVTDPTNAKRRFPVWTLRTFGTITDIVKGKFLAVPEQAKALLEGGSVEVVDEAPGETMDQRPEEERTLPAHADFSAHESMVQELKDHIRDMELARAPDAARHVLRLFNEGKITGAEHAELQQRIQARIKPATP